MVVLFVFVQAVKFKRVASACQFVHENIVNRRNIN